MVGFFRRFNGTVRGAEWLFLPVKPRRASRDGFEEI